MRNYELFTPRCLDEHAKRLVLGYALRGLLDDGGYYKEERLLAMQYGIYERWLADTRKWRPGFACGFYEWLLRNEDSAFIFRAGDLVKYNGRYCVVMNQLIVVPAWESKWRILDKKPRATDWPSQTTTLDVKEADGRIHCVNGLDGGLEPADIPPEVFALACGKAKDCPMLKGGRLDGE